MFLLDRIFSKTSPVERTIAGVFICITFFIFVLGPLFEQNKTLNKEILEKNNKFFRYRQLIKRERIIKREYQKSSPASDNVAADNSLIYALKTLEVVASRYAIKIIDIKQSTPGEGDSNALIELSLEGKKEDYMKFIYNLANGRLLFNINKCNFKPKENSYLLEARFLISYIPAH